MSTKKLEVSTKLLSLARANLFMYSNFVVLEDDYGHALYDSLFVLGAKPHTITSVIIFDKGFFFQIDKADRRIF